MLRRFGQIVPVAVIDSMGAVMLDPTDDQQLAINRYWHTYKKAHGFAPVGIHFLPVIDQWVQLLPTDTAPDLPFQGSVPVPD